MSKSLGELKYEKKRRVLFATSIHNRIWREECKCLSDCPCKNDYRMTNNKHKSQKLSKCLLVTTVLNIRKHIKERE